VTPSNSSHAEEGNNQGCAQFLDIGLPHDLIALGELSGVEQIVDVIDDAFRRPVTFAGRIQRVYGAEKVVVGALRERR
jgi:hypothetical protein